MSGDTLTIGELCRTVTGGDLVAMARLLNDAGAVPRLDAHNPLPADTVKSEVVIALADQRLVLRDKGVWTMQTRPIDAAGLADVPAWERANSAKLLEANMLSDGQWYATALPVVDVTWYVNVWNSRADLVLVTADAHRCVDELFDLDAQALDDLFDQVLECDHGGGLKKSGLYYPLTQESQDAFDRLMETAEPRE